MRITYLKLINFIGIYNGTGLSEFEMKFDNNKNKIVLLLGKNGSGKSSVLSTLHPFASTLDDRTEFILSGRDGYKEIHIENNGRKYIIKHFFKRNGKGKLSTKSFIGYWDDKKFIELNENGTVKSFAEYVKQELDVTEDFFVLTRIGSNVSGFIKKSSSDRKKFISDFLPDIEEYLYNYKIINDKWSASKKEIKTITDQINKLDSKEHLETRKKDIEQRIEEVANRVNMCNKLINEYEGRISVLDPDSSSRKEYSKLSSDLLDRETDLANCNISKYLHLGDFEECKRKQLLIDSKKELRETELANFTEKEYETNTRYLKLQSEIADKKERLSHIKLERDLSEYLELRTNYEGMINEKEYLLMSFPEWYQNYYKDIKADELIAYQNKMIDLCKTLQTIMSKYTLENIENALICDINYINETINNKKSLRRQKGEELVAIKDHYKELLNNARQKDILDQRPSDCTNNMCPFIREALKFVNIDKELNDEQRRMDDKEKEIASLTEELESLANIYNAFVELNTIYKTINTDYLIGKTHFFVNFNNITFKDFVLSHSQEQYYYISPILDYVYTLADIKEYEANLKEINSNIQILEDKESIIKMLENDIIEIQKEISQCYFELEDLKWKIIDTKDKLVKIDALKIQLEEAVGKMSMRERLKEEIDKIKIRQSELSSTMTKIEDMQRKIDIAAIEVEKKEQERKPLDKDLDKIKYDLQKLEDFKERKEKLDTVFNNLNILRDALSPTKGIPLLYIDVYLQKSKSITNNLLDLAFKGNFQIEDFELTDKDFFIKARRDNGEPLSDISIASQGEKALASLTISMALIQQSMKKYNILLLDEIDAELDSSNRSAFIQLLEKQFEVLGVEQAFLITHNREFDSQPVDLVLLKNHGVDVTDDVYMENKNIIFQIGKTTKTNK